MKNDFEIPRNWSAMLTSKNADKIAERILEILDNTTYSVVVVNEFYMYEPEIKVSQRLHREHNHPNPVTVQRFSDLIQELQFLIHMVCIQLVRSSNLTNMTVMLNSRLISDLLTKK